MTLDQWNTIALWIIASFFLVMLLVMVFVGIPVALDIKRTVKHLRGTLDEVRIKLDPVLFKAQAVADDIQEMTATAKREASRMGASVEKMSERIDDFASLVEVVQTEIEKPLLRTVATVAGAKKMLSRWF
jgi:uncharacterized protein YoxC